jgi:hypothetical protein
MKNRFNAGFIALIAAIGMIGIYFAIENYYLKRALDELQRNRDADFRKLVAAERRAIINDVNEKYRADMVSYEALARRMKIEKENTRKLEEKLIILQKDKNPGQNQ